ncbi:sigma-54-dependent transcriptional regulator [Gimesia sp.]|uniref:sigma-54-dependent transcriptional regulator n=1 Tax=Gimesia sp. TaxID=2024833 RepID=UPI003A944178
MNNKQNQKILIADDEPLYLKTTGQLLRKAGFDCVCVSSAGAAIAKLESDRFDLILSDLNMPGNLKLELLHQGRTNWPHIPLIVVTGVPSMPSAIESIRLGITDYLLKPVKFEDLLTSVNRALETQSKVFKRSEMESDIERSDLSARFPEVVGSSPPILEILDIVDRIAETDVNVLITGESGTGKEVVAHTIHQHSLRRTEKFQVIDCTAIPESLFESVLFGHAKGAFTGAVSDQEGLLKQADQGTAFFDEIGELPAASQSKLLRAIQESRFTPVGKNKSLQIDSRFICATNRDLEAEVGAGRFRGDLYYRLGVIHIELPPLRERGEDTVLLAEHFLKKIGDKTGRKLNFSPETLDCLREYSWPGNIRELKNVVERSVALTRSETIEKNELPESLLKLPSVPSHDSSGTIDGSRNEAIENAEYEYLTALLEKHDGNISQAAQQAGVSRQGLHKLLNKHNISAADFRS